MQLSVFHKVLKMLLLIEQIPLSILVLCKSYQNSTSERISTYCEFVNCESAVERRHTEPETDFLFRLVAN